MRARFHGCCTIPTAISCYSCFHQSAAGGTVVVVNRSLRRVSAKRDNTTPAEPTEAYTYTTRVRKFYQHATPAKPSPRHPALEVQENRTTLETAKYSLPPPGTYVCRDGRRSICSAQYTFFAKMSTQTRRATLHRLQSRAPINSTAPPIVCWSDLSATPHLGQAKKIKSYIIHCADDANPLLLHRTPALETRSIARPCSTFNIHCRRSPPRQRQETTTILKLFENALGLILGTKATTSLIHQIHN